MRCVECGMDCGQWHGHGMWFLAFGIACAWHLTSQVAWHVGNDIWHGMWYGNWHGMWYVVFGMGIGVACCLTAGVCHWVSHVSCAIRCGMWCMAFHMGHVDVVSGVWQLP